MNLSILGVGRSDFLHIVRQDSCQAPPPKFVCRAEILHHTKVCPTGAGNAQNIDGQEHSLRLSFSGG